MSLSKHDTFFVNIQAESAPFERSRADIEQMLLDGELCSEDEVSVLDQPQGWQQLGDHDDFIHCCPNNRRRPTSEMVSSRPYIVVLVDLTLLLVIFFVLTTGSQALHLLQLPPVVAFQKQSGSGSTVPALNDIYVLVTGESYKIGDSQWTATVSVEELADILRDAASSEPDRESRVLVEPQRDSLSSQVIKAIDAARMSGIARRAIVGKRTQGTENYEK